MPLSTSPETSRLVPSDRRDNEGKHVVYRGLGFEILYALNATYILVRSFLHACLGESDEKNEGKQAGCTPHPDR